MSLIWTNKWICKKYHPNSKHIHVPKSVPVMPPFYMEWCSSCCGRSELEKKLEINPNGSPQLQCMDLYYTPPLPSFRNASLCTLRYEYLNIAQDLINNRNIHSSSHNKNSTTQLAGTSMQLQNEFSLQPHSFCLLGPWVNRGNNPVQCQKVGHGLDMIHDCIQVSGNLHVDLTQNDLLTCSAGPILPPTFATLGMHLCMPTVPIRYEYCKFNQYTQLIQ